jgi:hypothetical protein
VGAHERASLNPPPGVSTEQPAPLSRGGGPHTSLLPQQAKKRCVKLESR